MQDVQTKLDSAFLRDVGLNLQAAIPLEQLPETLRQQLHQACPQAADFRQLLLFGNGGPRFWQAAQTHMEANANLTNAQEAHPLDQFSITMVEQFIRDELGAEASYLFLYPGSFTLNLQSLGSLLAWHQNSPLMIGIHPEFGLWSAYRVLVLCNSNFASSLPLQQRSAEQKSVSICVACQTRACVQACPANAMDHAGFHLDRCWQYRSQEESMCRVRCVARLACPVGTEHRYSDEQIHYHYAQSLVFMRK
ncbi:hypothetical protein RF679_13645 [Undibacterium cyanobacteriorum]|uniref:4Fe-4S ferredoxin-type domain-containing protein n=1 Tax=Undibacterium cyanobacteriorum TaxID=3073561 RepID=A0ABY9RG96_9BURK|nr:hypothetical protein [Undibacterium sp. 20NA77.5]WMW79689.1 hypothetical protein RF679_13645 [Undibacterium sp. 20NA77.5]